jgi:hypothetical protein
VPLVNAPTEFHSSRSAVLERPQRIAFRPVSQSGWIEATPGKHPTRCRILEISDRDAKVEVATPSEISDEFILLLTADGRVTRKCQVVQRSEKDLDVKFMSIGATPPRVETATPTSSETVRLET